MTVRDLIGMLEDFDEDAEIRVQAGGDYAYDIEEVLEGYGIRAFYGDDYKCLILKADEQVGAIWEEDELDLDEVE